MESNYFERIGITAKDLAIEYDEDEDGVIGDIVSEIKQEKEDTAFFNTRATKNELLPYHSPDCLTARKIKRKRKGTFPTASTTNTFEKRPTDPLFINTQFIEDMKEAHVHDMRLFFLFINNLHQGHLPVYINIKFTNSHFYGIRTKN